MNTENIMSFFGSKLDVRLDNSEFYDFQISKTMGDYEPAYLDLTTKIEYDSLVMSSSLEDFTHIKRFISLTEYDYSGVDETYIFSGMTLSLNYSLFTSHFDTEDVVFSHILLNNNIFAFTGVTNEVHYFTVNGYNQVTYIDPLLIGFNESMVISGFSTSVITCENTLLEEALPCELPYAYDVKPWVYQIGDETNGFIINKRSEKGWTLDFILNREGSSWSDGGTFYYCGVRGDDNPDNYLDNNLSFEFTDNGEIKWNAIRYSGYCDTVSGYTGTTYTTTGSTSPLCVDSLTKDFNVTIVFERYRYFYDCDIENEGGTNDLIVDGEVILNEKWFSERYKRLGDLRIYLNGVKIYEIGDWEEVILSDRGVQPFIQSWGGGTPLMGDLHYDKIFFYGVSLFNYKSIKYYQEPISSLGVKHNFLTSLNDYDFIICGGQDCSDNLTVT